MSIKSPHYSNSPSSRTFLELSEICKIGKQPHGVAEMKLKHSGVKLHH